MSAALREAVDESAADVARAAAEVIDGQKAELDSLRQELKDLREQLEEFMPIHTNLEEFRRCADTSPTYRVRVLYRRVVRFTRWDEARDFIKVTRRSRANTIMSAINETEGSRS